MSRADARAVGGAGPLRAAMHVASLALVCVLVAAACRQDDATPEPCTDIPVGGCPLSHGVACEDPSCAAVYACREGNVWELDRKCPPRPDAGVDASPPVDATDARPVDAAIDAPPGAYGGPGCLPLQPPDCPLGLALSCANAGCCDCEELFVCRNGGWESWGTCSADGGIAPR